MGEMGRVREKKHLRARPRPGRAADGGRRVEERERAPGARPRPSPRARPLPRGRFFFLSLDPFLPYVRGHSSHISPLNYLTDWTFGRDGRRRTEADLQGRPGQQGPLLSLWTLGTLAASQLVRQPHPMVRYTPTQHADATHDAGNNKQHSHSPSSHQTCFLETICFPPHQTPLSCSATLRILPISHRMSFFLRVATVSHTSIFPTRHTSFLPTRHTPFLPTCRTPLLL